MCIARDLKHLCRRVGRKIGASQRHEDRSDPPLMETDADLLSGGSGAAGGEEFHGVRSVFTRHRLTCLMHDACKEVAGGGGLHCRGFHGRCLRPVCRCL